MKPKVWTGFLMSRELALIVLIILGFTLLSHTNRVDRSTNRDLRNRVVGARLLVGGEDPYFHHWTEGQPEEWVDPAARPAWKVNRNTVTPSMLAGYTLISSLPYRQIQWVWFVASWAMALATLLLLVGLASGREKKRLQLYLLFLGFLAGEAWLYHIETGQCYIVFTLFTAAAAWFSVREKETPTGIALGLAAGLRPTILLALFPLMLARRWKAAAAMLLGLVLTFIATSGVAKLSHWQSYYLAMREHGRVTLKMDVDPMLRKLVSRHRPAVMELPGVIRFYTYSSEIFVLVKPSTDLKATRSVVEELCTPTVRPEQIVLLKGNGDLNVFRSSFSRMSSGLVAPFRHLPRAHRLNCLQAVLVFFLVSYCGLLGRAWKKDQALQVCVLIGTSLALMSDLFLPAPQRHYMNIGWAVPFALLLARRGPSIFYPGLRGVLLILGLLMANGLTAASWRDYGLGSWALCLYFGLICLNLAQDSEEHEELPASTEEAPNS